MPTHFVALNPSGNVIETVHKDDVGPDEASVFSSRTSGNIIVIERRGLVRECLTRSLRMASELDILSFATYEDWLEVAHETPASLIVLCTVGKSKPADALREASAIAHSESRIPTIILSDAEDLEHIVAALDGGAQGYIPTSTSLDVAIQAIKLVQAGGVFVPASSVIAARKNGLQHDAPSDKHCQMFTARQQAVVEAIRRGKANKIIAYELNMCESTVKVHVRNIMKKLRAKNRGEVAFMTNERIAGEFE